MTGENLRKTPTGLSRWAFRFPIHLYHWRLGWVMGGRFLLLHHLGRKSGKPREAVVEVVRHDAETGSYYICSGFGEKSQWYQNLMAHPDVTIQVRTREIQVHAQRLNPTDGVAEMLDYAKRHPSAAKKLAGFMGFPADGRTATYEEVGRVLPFIRLSPIK